ncbi:DNA-3-methyladenine glycosylase family protein, partial [Pseudomonadota bacterium]
IWERFVELVGEEIVQPQRVIKLKHEKMREVGLSNAKAMYVAGMAEKLLSKEIEIENLHELADKEVVSQLTKFKGVGQWTAEMFLMFTLGRKDLFSAGDLGLRRAMERLYNLDDPSDEELVKLAEKWSPYRTYACRVLWESLDNNPDV